MCCSPRNLLPKNNGCKLSHSWYGQIILPYYHLFSCKHVLAHYRAIKDRGNKGILGKCPVPALQKTEWGVWQWPAYRWETIIRHRQSACEPVVRQWGGTATWHAADRLTKEGSPRQPVHPPPTPTPSQLNLTMCSCDCRDTEARGNTNPSRNFQVFYKDTSAHTDQGSIIFFILCRYSTFSKA